MILLCLNCEKKLAIPDWISTNHNNTLRTFCCDKCMREWLGLRPMPDIGGEEE